MIKNNLLAFALMVSWHGLLFKEVEVFWKNLRKFAFNNRSLFEISFILLYTIEQATLIWLTYIIDDVTQLALVISIFALIVITTFSIHKHLMDSRIKTLEDEVKSLQLEKRELDESLAEAKEQFIITASKFTENLNNRNSLGEHKEEVKR